MILSESLWPGMTRHGFCYSTCVRIRPDDRENFPLTSTDHWLPLVKVSIKEILIARREVSIIRRREGYNSMAVVAFEAIELNDDTGCWLSSEVTVEDDEGHTKALWQIAELDMGGSPLDEVDDKDALRVCDDANCLNARHYDFTHRKTYRDRLLKPDYSHYETLDDGGVVALWEAQTGLVLPSLRESIDQFRELQKRCVPYTDNPTEAPLSDNGISKITIDPITGCWSGRMYYTRPDDFGKSFQFDGYSRLGVGPGLRRKGQAAYQQLGHRVLMRATGVSLRPSMVVNHECGFRPCCFPGHLTEISHSDNVEHGRRMSRVRGMQSTLPEGII